MREYFEDCKGPSIHNKFKCNEEQRNYWLKIGLAMGRVFSGTRPVPPLMGRGLILINGFGMGMNFFLKPGMGSGIAPSCLEFFF